jgi:hypothetical protein
MTISTAVSDLPQDSRFESCLKFTIPKLLEAG